jgi:hypothetical protein
MFVMQTDAPPPPLHACHPMLDVQFVSPLANSGFNKSCDVPDEVVCSSLTQSTTIP